MKILHLISTCAALGLAGAAQAAVITQSFSFTASDHVLTFGDGSVLPIEPATFSATITLDNSQTYAFETSGLTFSSNLPYGATFGYSPGSDLLVFATLADSNSCTNTANTFCSFIQNFSTSPFVAFAQQSTSVAGYWTANTIVQGMGAVPEPGTWALLLVGFGTLGVALRRRRRTTLAYA